MKLQPVQLSVVVVLSNVAMILSNLSTYICEYMVIKTDKKDPLVMNLNYPIIINLISESKETERLSPAVSYVSETGCGDIKWPLETTCVTCL